MRNSFAAIVRSDGFKYLEENNPSLKCEVLKTVGGSESVSAQLSDVRDDSGRRVRQRVEDDKAESTAQL